MQRWPKPQINWQEFHTSLGEKPDPGNLRLSLALSLGSQATIRLIAFPLRRNHLKLGLGVGIGQQLSAQHSPNCVFVHSWLEKDPGSVAQGILCMWKVPESIPGILSKRFSRGRRV